MREACYVIAIVKNSQHESKIPFAKLHAFHSRSQQQTAPFVLVVWWGAVDTTAHWTVSLARKRQSDDAGLDQAVPDMNHDNSI